MVLRRPAPMILFRAFGADALEFEIRAYLRDINYIMGVGSDLHFAIAERFRKEGIEIPFGQRDLWFRNADALAEAFRAAAAPPPETPEPPREAAPTREVSA
jgi:small-conductance mechanosensitive channel